MSMIISRVKSRVLTSYRHSSEGNKMSSVLGLWSRQCNARDRWYDGSSCSVSLKLPQASMLMLTRALNLRGVVRKYFWGYEMSAETFESVWESASSLLSGVVEGVSVPGHRKNMWKVLEKGEGQCLRGTDWALWWGYNMGNEKGEIEAKLEIYAGFSVSWGFWILF
jgi:hypothetical protein